MQKDKKRAVKKKIENDFTKSDVFCNALDKMISTKPIINKSTNTKKYDK
jgi:hypothetical protein